MSFSLHPKYSINTWLSDPKVPKGATKHNVTYLREVKDIIDELSKMLCYLYFLSKHVNNYYAQSMFGSFKKQKEFFVIVKGGIKRRQITSEYVPAFEQQRKAEEKERRDFEKERAKNLHKHRMEEAAIDRSLRHLYRDAERHWGA